MQEVVFCPRAAVDGVLVEYCDVDDHWRVGGTNADRGDAAGRISSYIEDELGTGKFQGNGADCCGQPLTIDPLDAISDRDDWTPVCRDEARLS